MSPKVQGTFRQALDQAHREFDEQEISPSDKKIAQLSSKHITNKSLDLKIGFKGVVGRVRAAISSSKILSLGRTAADQLLRKAKGIAAEVKKPKQEKKMEAYRALLQKCAAGKLTNKEALRLALKLPLFMQNLPSKEADILRRQFRIALADLHAKGIRRDSPLYPLAKMSLLDTSLGHTLSREDQQFLQNRLERNFTDLEGLYTQEEIKALPLQRDFFKTGLQKALQNDTAKTELVDKLKKQQAWFQLKLGAFSKDNLNPIMQHLQNVINEPKEENYLSLRKFCVEAKTGDNNESLMLSELKTDLFTWESDNGVIEIDVREEHEKNQLLVLEQKLKTDKPLDQLENDLLKDFPRFIKSVVDKSEQTQPLLETIVNYFNTKAGAKSLFTQNIWLQIEGLLEKLGSSEDIQDPDLQLLLTTLSLLNPIVTTTEPQMAALNLQQLLQGDALQAEKEAFTTFVESAANGFNEWFTICLVKLSDLQEVNFQNAAELLLIIQEFLKKFPTYAAKEEAGAGADDITPIVIYLLAEANNKKVLDLIELLEKFSSSTGGAGYICTTLAFAKGYILKKLEEKTPK